MTTKSKKAKGVAAPEPTPQVATAPPVPAASSVPTVDVGSLAVGESFHLSKSLFRVERAAGDKVLVAEMNGSFVVNRYFIPADTEVVKL